MVPCYKIQKVSTIDVFAQILFKECVLVLTTVESWEASQKSLLKTGQNPEFTKNDYRSGTVNSNTVNSKFHLIRSKEPVRKEKSLRHFHVTTAAAQPSSCSVAHVYMLACSKQKAASSCTFNTNSCTVNTKMEACLHRSGLFKWIIT